VHYRRQSELEACKERLFRIRQPDKLDESYPHFNGSIAAGGFPCCKVSQSAISSLLVQLGPRFNEPSLTFWKRTRNQFNRIDAKNADFLLIISVKVRDVMLCANLHEHSNDDAEETAQFGHRRILHSARHCSQCVVRPTKRWSRRLRGEAAQVPSPQTTRGSARLIVKPLAGYTRLRS